MINVIIIPSLFVLLKFRTEDLLLNQGRKGLGFVDRVQRESRGDDGGDAPYI